MTKKVQMPANPEIVKRRISTGPATNMHANAAVMREEKAEAYGQLDHQVQNFVDAVESEGGPPNGPGGSRSPGASAEPPRRRNSPVEFTIPNGLHIVLGPPPEAIQYRLARIYKKDLADDLSTTFAKAQFYIRSINGVPEPLPNHRHDLELQANRLETDGLDMVAEKYVEHFLGIDFEALKKNLL